MDFLGVGPLELIFLLLIIFLVLGPKDIAKTGKKLGRFLSTVRKSEAWRGITQVTREMRDLPTTLMREAELEDVKQALEQDAKELKGISKEFQDDRLNEVTAEIQASMKLKLDNKKTPAPSESQDEEAGTPDPEEGNA